MSALAHEAPVDAAVSFCKRCQSRLQSRVAFCPYCGIAEPHVVAAQAHAIASAANPALAQPVAATAQQPSSVATTAKVATSKEPVAQQPAKGQAQQVVTPRQLKRGRPILWVSIALAALAIVGRLAAPPSANAPATAPPPPGNVYYITRSDAPVHTAPSGLSNSPTTLPRGQPVRGIWQGAARGHHKWLRLTEGSYAGDFVWDENLSAAPPPTLSLTIESELRVNQDTPIYSAPSTTSAVLGFKSAGSSVYAAGKTSDGWIELHIESGGVGYAPESAF